MVFGRMVGCVSAAICIASASNVSASDVIRLETRQTSADVALSGARVMSFKVRGDEVLWRPNAWNLGGGKWHHGGIPVCWPWFGWSGVDTNVIHGFARDMKFSVRRKSLNPDRCELVLGLKSDEATRKCWPHDFDLEYSIVLTDRLALSLKTTNVSDAPFVITVGFHPYFAIGDRDRTTVTGTDGLRFCDSRITRKCDNVWQGDMRLLSSLDHVFIEPSKTAFHAIVDPVRGRRIAVSSSGASRLVVWNPGTEEPASEAPQPGSLKVGDWRHLICVEPAILWRDAAVTVSPGSSHVISATISLDATEVSGR